MADFPDANLWVALTSVDHEFHERAVDYWVRLAEPPVSFCRTTALGLTRVLSTKHSVGGTPLSYKDSWYRYRGWREDPGIVFAQEPYGVEEALARLIEANLVTSKNSTDAYLAAFAISAGLRLVSFDRDFERFPGLSLLRP